jgi:hypothetical protein
MPPPSTPAAGPDNGERGFARAAADKITRLSINLSLDAAQALRDLTTEKGISITEGVRRAIAVWKFVEDEKSKGNRLAVLEPGRNGEERVREVVLIG